MSMVLPARLYSTLRLPAVSAESPPPDELVAYAGDGAQLSTLAVVERTCR